VKQLAILDGKMLDAAGVSASEGMAAIEAGLAAICHSTGQQPPPPVLHCADGGFFQPLVAALPSDDVACVNWLSYHPGNMMLGRPHSRGTLLLNEFATGEPLCVMDGIWISHRRTGYVAGLAAKYLAGNVGDVALIGPGAIAAFAVDALAALGYLSGELRVCARSSASAERFCAEISSRLGVRARPVHRARDTLRGARLVITATTHSGAPFIDRGWLEDGTLIIMIDRLRVITPGLLAQADRIVTTSRESLARWGFDRLDRIGQTLPEIIAAGQPLPVGPDEVTLCDAGGLAIADLALAALLWRRLTKQRER
jgi:ornithine cyclodeaminase/alanine dehydrogenase-like protein (mu-crystallin family)